MARHTIIRAWHCPAFFLSLATLLLLFTASPGLAAERIWTGTDSNLWSAGGAGGNWNGQAAPVSGDQIEFGLASSLNLNQTNDIAGLSNMAILMDRAAGDVTINGQEIGLETTFGGYAITNTPASPSELTINAPLRLDGDARIISTSFPDINVNDINLNGHTLVLGRGVNCLGTIQGLGSVIYNGYHEINTPRTYIGYSRIENNSHVAANHSLPSMSAVVIEDIGLYEIIADNIIGSLRDYGSGNGRVDIRPGVSLFTGGNNGNTTFSGRISNSGTLVKAGTGTMALTGSNAHTGAVQVNNGTLSVSGSMDSASFEVANGATLLLRAAERLRDTAPVTLDAGGTFNLNGFNETISRLSGEGTVTTGAATLTIATALNPGTSTGVITLGNFNLAAGAVLNIEHAGPNPGTGYDRITATGNVTLAGNLILASTATPQKGDVFIIIDKTSPGAVAGTFNGLPEGEFVRSGGNNFRISYAGGDGNDVTLTALTGSGEAPAPAPTPDPMPTPDPKPKPGAPTGTSPSPTTSLNGPSLSWPRVSGADSYRVYRAACPTCPKEEIGRVRDTSFVDQSALPDQVYYYFVRGEGSGGFSDFSDWMAAWRYEQNPGRAGDFNGDGIADLLWWEPDTNELKIWLMKGGAVQSVVSPGAGQDISQWLLINTGDFNNDGVCDIMWWNPQAGAVEVWYMSRTQGAAAGAGDYHVKDSSSPGRIMGNSTLSYTGDLNGDGRSDILWRDYETGQVTLWIMGADGQPQLNGPPTLAAGMTDGNRPGVTGSLEWGVRGLFDMDGDGKADVIWQHAGDGRIVLWRMDGAQATNHAVLQQDANYCLAGMGDLDGDGRADFVWSNQSSGAIMTWLMRSGVFNDEIVIVQGSAEAAKWQVKAVGDFCAPGCDDVYCKHSETGAVRIVKLDGQSFAPTVE